MSDCKHEDKIFDLKDAVFGKGGIKEKVIRLEVQIWIVIVLLLGNGGLVYWTLNKISELKK